MSVRSCPYLDYLIFFLGVSARPIPGKRVYAIQRTHARESLLMGHREGSRPLASIITCLVGQSIPMQEPLNSGRLLKQDGLIPRAPEG